MQSTNLRPANQLANRTGPKFFKIPRQQPRSGTRPPPDFLVDNALYVFGKGTSDKPVKDENQAVMRAQWFRNEVEKCAVSTQDEGISAVLHFLDDLATGKQAVVLPPEVRSNELFAFVYEPDIDMLVTERPKVQAYWRSIRNSGSSDETQTQICLVSGQLCTPVRKHTKLKNVPTKGKAGDIALISNNRPAFWSFGWEESENAPISRDASEACTTALNRLLHPTYPALPRRNLRLSADTVVCFWSAQKSEDDFSSAFAGLLAANPDEVKQVYQSIWRGRPPDIEDPSSFYALTLTGTQGRAIVRDWFETTVAKVEKNLSTHFDDLSIVRNAHPPKGQEHPPQIPLGLLFESLSDPARNRQENIPAPLVVQFTRAAFSGTIYPLAVLQRALLRFRAEIGNEQDQDPKVKWATKQ